MEKRTKGFGPILMAGVAAMLGGLIAPTKEQIVKAADDAVREHFGKRKPKRDSDILDPYFGIASKGRTGATARAEMMAEAMPHRPSAPRKLSNPFKHEARRRAFDAALKGGARRADAMKVARRVPMITA